MTEAQVGFLFKAASSLPQPGNNQYLTLLRSHYLTRCKQITKGYGLPEKLFSSKVRCSHCCTEWRKGTPTRIKPIKLSKKQKQKIRAQKTTKKNKAFVKSQYDLLHSNQVEQICLFCKNTTLTSALKPEKTKVQTIKEADKGVEAEIKIDNVKKLKRKVTKADSKKTSEVNVYSLAKDVFSLKNQNNTVASARKEEPKVINNNKKKKDKFAGLCQKAVLASVKLKQEKAKQNKLNLFLKPSSG